MRPSGKHAAAAVVTRGGAIAAAAANAEVGEFQRGFAGFVTGEGIACLGGGMGFGAPDSGRDFSSLGKFLVGL
jgi:hypothetical protein